MARSTSKTQTRAATRLAREKGSELVGLSLLLLGLLLGASLVTYDPADPSFLHRISGGAEVANLIGPIGSEVAAAAFGFVGLTCLLVPVLLVLAAWRRLRPRPQNRVVGRGLGAALLLASLPGLLQLTLERVSWRVAEISAGVYCTVWIGSLAELTPPPAMSLMYAAPSAKFSRVARSTSGTPSARRMRRSRSRLESRDPDGAVLTWLRRRRSPWPEVWVMYAPQA